MAFFDATNLDKEQYIYGFNSPYGNLATYEVGGLDYDGEYWAQTKLVSKYKVNQLKGFDSGYIDGGLSVLSALITYVCLFTAYGKERYLVLQEATGDTTDVPETVADFVSWLLNNLEVNDLDTEPSRGIGKDKALRFLDEFSRTYCISSTYTHKDLSPKELPSYV